MEIKIFIVEDELLHLKDLSALVEEAGYKLVGHCANADEAFIQIKETQPDVLLVDIALPGVNNGISLSHKVHTELHIPHIFTTSACNDEVVEQAIETRPVGFLQKPVDYGELTATVGLAIQSESQEDAQEDDREEVQGKNGHEILFTRVGNRLIRIKLDQVRFARAASDKYISVNLGKRELTCRIPLKDLLSQKQATFIQIHRSAIVNLDYLTEIDEFNMTAIVGNTELPIGRRYRKELFRILKKV